MSKDEGKLSNTAAIAGKPVLQTANPNFSGFCNRDMKGLMPQRQTSVGPESPPKRIK
jgi:hypothetical protein